jgi:hemoglobin
MSAIPPRFDITGASIDQVVQTFYARVRAHPELGPVFGNHVGTTDADWDAHIAKIANFWRNAILREPVYNGNPMQVHMQARDVRVGHFEPWLGLFEEVLRAELPQDVAETWLALTHRIARGFKIQLADRDNPSGIPALV